MLTQRDLEKDIVGFMQKHGPVIPIKIAKHMNTDTMLASAMLSELSSRGIIMISNVKVGGTPVYYLPEQVGRLVEYADNLNEKDKKTFDKLSSEKVIRDKDASPLERVSLRTLKDFAKPVEVSIKGEKELFWKYFLAKNEEITPLIKKLMGIDKKTVRQLDSLQEEKKEKYPPIYGHDSSSSRKNTGISSSSIKPYKGNEYNKISEEDQEDQEDQESLVSVVSGKRIKEEAAEEKQSLITGEIGRDAGRGDASKRNSRKEARIINRPAGKEQTQDADFLETLYDFFIKNKIEVISEEILRKNSEIDFIISMPSPVGKLKYYCKARNKKRISDGDLSSVFIAGQMKKMPTMCVITGEMTKKAEKMLDKELSGMVVKKI